MKRLAIIVGALALVALQSGCADTRQTRTQLDFGTSNKLSVFNQTYNLEAEKNLEPVLGLAHELREAGLSVEFSLKQQSVGKQLKLAAARPARWAVMVGPDERAAGSAVVRNLESGSEERVAFTDLSAYCAAGE